MTDKAKTRSSVMKQAIRFDREKIAEFCKRNRIRKLSLFGSVLREDFGPHSDVDILVEFESCAAVGFFELYDLEQELSAMWEVEE
jgi:predicted nucleotidyltransferase